MRQSIGPIEPIHSTGDLDPILLEDGSALWVYKSTELGQVVVIIEREA